MGRAHTDREYEGELRELNDALLRMGGRVEDMLRQATRALTDDDIGLASAIIQMDQQIDQDEMDIDERCLLLLARRQPVASDLRFITFALKMVTDLERVGDLVGHVCERILELHQAGANPGSPELARLAAQVQVMLHDAIDAFARRDAAGAEAVLAQDDAIDDLYHQLFRDLVGRMSRGEASVHHCIPVQHMGKSIERIGDHATNIAEQTIFLVKGKDVRHRKHRDDLS